MVRARYTPKSENSPKASFLAKYWLRALFVTGVAMLSYAFHYDTSYAGNFSWDVPPDSMDIYWQRIAIADRLYKIALTILGAAAVSLIARWMIRLWNLSKQLSSSALPPG